MQLGELRVFVVFNPKVWKRIVFRLDEYDKKNEEISRKFSTLLQELNKCKTELQYWRCKSPATPSVCTTCGTPVVPPPEELQVLANQGISPEGLGKFCEMYLI